MKHKIICGDCIEEMDEMESKSVDLIYSDSPFGDNGTDMFFNIHWNSIQDYLEWMEPKIRECYRVLKDTGSMYLHCDWHANAHLRILMDKIFGENNFRNEIIWCYSTSGRGKKEFSKKHDTIFFYSKTAEYFWDEKGAKIPYSKEYIKSHFRNTDEKGRRCRKRYDAGKWRIYYPDVGMNPNDWWELPYVNSMAKERLGYPTQKPETLLERIIKASSTPTSIVLDPMCGCGTCMAVAHKLGRQWIGIDVSPTACKLSYQRLLKELLQLKMDKTPYVIEKKGF
jgi:DNA modification methylase